MANGNHNHVIISCPCWVWDDDFIREGTVPSSRFIRFLAHLVLVKTENKIRWEWCLCFQWEQWTVPADSQALAELLCEHTSVLQLWFWRKQHSSREGPNLWFMSIISTLALKWWWGARPAMRPAPRESQPLSPSRDPAWFCGCCFTKRIRSHRFRTH